MDDHQERLALLRQELEAARKVAESDQLVSVGVALRAVIAHLRREGIEPSLLHLLDNQRHDDMAPGHPTAGPADPSNPFSNCSFGHGSNPGFCYSTKAASARSSSDTSSPVARTLSMRF